MSWYFANSDPDFSLGKPTTTMSRWETLSQRPFSCSTEEFSKLLSTVSGEQDPHRPPALWVREGLGSCIPPRDTCWCHSVSFPPCLLPCLGVQSGTPWLLFLPAWYRGCPDWVGRDTCRFLTTPPSSIYHPLLQPSQICWSKRTASHPFPARRRV